MSTSTKASKAVYIDDLHHDHMMWLNVLRFCKDEIGIFERRMEDVVRRNNAPEVMAELEHFQNQYIREREVIDELKHDIKQHENMLEKEAIAHPIAIDHRHFTDHTELRERMATFEKLYGELKQEFMRWVGRWM
ncbi:MAG: hypothetical protein KF905_12860 [Flavobacteriales bacterium]|nr:hypothetical protein [Flavobacteriales bacterium]